MASCRITELEGDLFTVDKSYSLAHCVAEDLKMGKGIAVKFRDKFGQIAKLRQQNAKTGGVAFLKYNDRFIYYLITKGLSWQKPTYSMLECSLLAMRGHMRENSITKLALPRIGCGLDGLSWPKVKYMLEDVFKQDSFEIVVYSYKTNK